jgi:hypothetical protein
LGATGGTGRPIVRFRRGHGSLEGDLPRVDMMVGDARDEGTLTCSLVVKGAEHPCLMPDAEAFPSCSALNSVAYQSRLIAERFELFKPEEEDRFLI